MDLQDFDTSAPKITNKVWLSTFFYVHINVEQRNLSWRKNTTSWKIHLIFFIKKAPTLCFTCAALWNTSRVSIKVFFSCAFWSIALEKVNGNGKVKFKKTKMVTWGDFWHFVLNGRWEHVFQRSSDVVSRSPDQLFLPRDSNSGNSVTGLYLPGLVSCHSQGT